VFRWRLASCRKEEARVLNSRTWRQTLTRSIEVHKDVEEALDGMPSRAVPDGGELSQPIGIQLPLSPAAQREGAMKTYARSSVGTPVMRSGVGVSDDRVLLSSSIAYHYLSWHDESPLVDQEAHPLNDQLARKGLLSVHEVADQDEEHDEDVEVHGRREEEVVCEKQEGLGAIPALDGADDPGGLESGSAVLRHPEGDDLGQEGHARGGGGMEASYTWRWPGAAETAWWSDG
jgi:hypothetical protein